MDWIVTTARSVDEAQTRALDLLGVDLDDAEVQVIEEGKTGLFGRTKTEARVRARIKPKAPPVKDERRNNRNDRNRGGRNRGGGGGGRGRNQGGKGNGGQGGKGGQGGQSKGGQGRGGQGGGQGGGQKSQANGGQSKSGQGGKGQGRGGDGNQNNDGGNRGGRNRGGQGAGGGNKGNNNGRGRGGDRSRGGRRDDSDRVEMPIDEQRETLEAFVAGVAAQFDSSSTVTLVEEETTLIAQVEGDDLGRLVGQKAATLHNLEELARTAMHRAAAGRRYHRIQVDVDGYRARRREALERFAVQIAESVVASGEAKALEPMGAADRKLVHDAVSEISGVETVSEGRDPRRYIVILPLASDEEE